MRLYAAALRFHSRITKRARRQPMRRDVTRAVVKPRSIPRQCLAAWAVLPGGLHGRNENGFSEPWSGSSVTLWSSFQLMHV